MHVLFLEKLKKACAVVENVGSTISNCFLVDVSRNNVRVSVKHLH